MAWMRLTANKKVIFFTIFLVCCFLLFYFGLLKPQHKQIVELSNRVRFEQQRVQSIEKFAILHPDLDRYIFRLENKLLQAARILPEQPVVRDFLLQVESAADAADVKIMQIQPGISALKDGHYETPIEIVVRGNFFQTIVFIKRIEDCPRFNNMVRLSLQSQPDGLESHFVVIIYNLENITTKKTSPEN